MTHLRETLSLYLLTGTPRTFLDPQPGDTRAAATRSVLGAVLASVAVVVATVGADWVRALLAATEVAQ